MNQLLMLMGVVLTASTASDTRVEVCHVPPGDAGSAHTLTVAAAALRAHLAHGDLLGSCGTFCGLFCNTGNRCAQDTGTYDAALGRCVCTSAPVDCSATSPCLTTMGCDPAQGCVYAVNEGAACDADGNACTGPDVCDAAGICRAGGPVSGCCLSDSDCPQDACVQYRCEINTNSCEQSGATACISPTACEVAVCNPTSGCESAPVVCTPSDRCHVASCDPSTGCLELPMSCAAGTCSTPCGDACVNTDSDPANCGACGAECAEGEACNAGTCVPVNNPPTACVGACAATYGPVLANAVVLPTEAPLPSAPIPIQIGQAPPNPGPFDTYEYCTGSIGFGAALTYSWASVTYDPVTGAVTVTGHVSSPVTLDAACYRVLLGVQTAFSLSMLGTVSTDLIVNAAVDLTRIETIITATATPVMLSMSGMAVQVDGIAEWPSFANEITQSFIHTLDSTVPDQVSTAIASTSVPYSP